MSQYLFTYGTLQPGLQPPEIAPLVGKLRPIGAGFLLGTLYDLGEYPGAVIDPASPRRIYGTIIELPVDPGILLKLDAYEGFDANHPERSLFIRSRAPATLVETGQVLLCWTYALNGSPDPARVVASGRYVKQHPRASGPSGVP
jgi:gamma-glutamylcyclotransferase (GGCT)/AIG2-like uncharacterized protein YtfP